MILSDYRENPLIREAPQEFSMSRWESLSTATPRWRSWIWSRWETSWHHGECLAASHPADVELAEMWQFLTVAGDQSRRVHGIFNVLISYLYLQLPEQSLLSACAKLPPWICWGMLRVFETTALITVFYFAGKWSWEVIHWCFFFSRWWAPKEKKCRSSVNKNDGERNGERGNHRLRNHLNVFRNDPSWSGLHVVQYN